jgi:predicted nucleotidyltransferase
MKESNKLEPIEAAKLIVDTHYPGCQGALLAGSIVRGEATTTSDLDIVIFDEKIKSSFRESFIEYGWSSEIFVHNLTSYKTFFASDCERARPSLPRMVSEGIVLKDNGIIHLIKKEADELLVRGPQVWSLDTITIKRYFISDTLDDLIGCSDRSEGIFIANSLAEMTSEFVLRTNRKWIGTSKWIVRSLKQYDVGFAERFVHAFDCYYKFDEKHKIIQMVDSILRPYGGRLFEGFSIGKNHK